MPTIRQQDIVPGPFRLDTRESNLDLAVSLGGRMLDAPAICQTERAMQRLPNFLSACREASL